MIDEIKYIIDSPKTSSDVKLFLIAELLGALQTGFHSETPVKFFVSSTGQAVYRTSKSEFVICPGSRIRQPNCDGKYCERMATQRIDLESEGVYFACDECAGSFKSPPIGRISDDAVFITGLSYT